MRRDAMMRGDKVRVTEASTSMYKGKVGVVIDISGEEYYTVHFKDGFVETFEASYLLPANKTKQSVAWNKDKTGSVVLAKIKEFTVYQSSRCAVGCCWEVRGWFNKENSFLFGEFGAKEEATEFLESIHEMY
jgi:hypothetical protein